MEAARSTNAPSRRRRAKRMPLMFWVRRPWWSQVFRPTRKRRRPYCCTKRASADLATCSTKRECVHLGDDMAGLIAERVLAYDVADYIRFRAVCRSWRRCSVDPRAQGWLDRRFHPHWWSIFRDVRATPDRLRFLNTCTGESIWVDLPELRGHKVLGHSCEGFLVLLSDDHNHLVRLLNPLTCQLTHLPPITTLLVPSESQNLLSQWSIDAYFNAWGSGVSKDDSAFVLCLNSLRIVGIAKPGDLCWTLLKSDGKEKVSSMFAGPF